MFGYLTVSCCLNLDLLAVALCNGSGESELGTIGGIDWLAYGKRCGKAGAIGAAWASTLCARGPTQSCS